MEWKMEIAQTADSFFMKLRNLLSALKRDWISHNSFLNFLPLQCEAIWMLILIDGRYDENFHMEIRAH